MDARDGDALCEYKKRLIAELSTRHNAVEWDMIEILRDVYNRTASPIQMIHLLDLQDEHNRLEWKILEAYARLPKRIADEMRAAE